MNDDRNTEKIILRKMDPAASQRILNYLITELTRRNLLHPPDQSLPPEPSDAAPKER